jgi:general secretion pathway protein A
MYIAFFGLTKKPFNMTPDPAFLYLTGQHREALAGLTYSILDRKGFLVLSGMAGAGKTTLLAWVLKKMPVAKIRSSVIFNPTLTPSEFLELAMIDFGIKEIPVSKAQRLQIFQKFLLQGYRDQKVTVLIVDEAHKLSPEVLEEIRFLGNFEIADEKLLQVVLVGQSELDDLLNKPELWQFKQRISVRLALEPLAIADVGEYIAHRWQVAGGSLPAPFSTESIVAIFRLSRGIPRLINSICDNALVEAFADSANTVTSDHVRNAAKGLLLVEKPAPHLQPAQPNQPVQGAVTEDPPVPRLLPVPKLAMLGRPRTEPAPKQGMFARWAGRLRSG